MSIQRSSKLGQWITDNWLAGLSGDFIARKMQQQGCNNEVIANMRALLADMEYAVDFYSEQGYGLHLVEFHATRGGMSQ